MATAFQNKMQDGQRTPLLKTALPGPKASAWIARDRRASSPSYTRDYPLVMDHGLGCMVQDVDGNRFLDFTAGIAVNAVGHAHPEVVQAVAEQAGRMMHMSGTDFFYAAQVELAERLIELTPGKFAKRVFFTNSGAESVEAALKLARRHTRRHQIISFYGAFHGRTYGALSVNGSKAVHHAGFGPLLSGVHRLPFNCPQSALDDLFERVAPPEDVAAVIVEPVQGEGGYLIPDHEFLPMLRAVCDRRKILLIADEVQTGVGRTGRWFACEHFGVEPDMICLAKGLAGGMPLGAMVAKADVMDWPPGSHASTFGGNPVSCQASLKVLELIEREYLLNTVHRGEQLLRRLHDLSSRFDFLARPRGLGLMCAVDVLDRGQPSPTLRTDLLLRCFHAGLLLLGCGRSALRFCPSLCLTREELDVGLDLLTGVCEEIAKQR